MHAEAASDTDRRRAVLAEGLYLANLLVAPGFAFLGLLWLWRHTGGDFPLARAHLRQTIAASLWAGALLGGLSALILAIGGFASAWSWVWVILYFTFFHSTLVLFGMVGLSRALAGQRFRFPLIGLRDEGV
jgi:uncharacterized Tic20 family protein